MSRKNLTVKFAGTEYECANEQEYNDLVLCVSRAENTLRDQALTSVEANDNIKEHHKEGAYMKQSMLLTSNPETMMPAVETEYVSLLREREQLRKQAEYGNELSDDNERTRDEGMSMA
ncbi:MAG: hypothetical protein CMF61_02230 [Magnetococcales bacterium]|nr:hypothetical protein [Magnetococcales bacterium]PPR17844.1 MAG: hypothetical protein CFH43_00625 [Pseudomonadota bacterium]|tara:strand:- start:361 stop:714 length:354 start_codon:yes stop_codon:yes gene_type:complete